MLNIYSVKYIYLYSAKYNTVKHYSVFPNYAIWIRWYTKITAENNAEINSVVDF